MKYRHCTRKTFEQSLLTIRQSAMYSQDYDLTARSWIQAAELSTWSPTLYAYLTGVAYLESYRNVRESDPAAAKALKEKATEFLKKAPTMAGSGSTFFLNPLVLNRRIKDTDICLQNKRSWRKTCPSTYTSCVRYRNGRRDPNPGRLTSSMQSGQVH